MAASVALALLAASVAPAFDDRADRIAWRTPMAVAEADAAALQRTAVDRFEGHAITRVEIETVPGAVAPTPPGLRAAPGPGQVALSPALAALVDANPAASLGDRFPSRRLAPLGGAALAHADELVAVVGVAAGTLTAPDDDVAEPADAVQDLGDPTRIAGFATAGSDVDLVVYRELARVAAVLLLVPAALLVGAAARLTAARRQQRLAVLRLVGATPGAVIGVTAVETFVAAVAGTVIGAAVYVAGLPLAGRVPLAGGRFAAADLLLDPRWLLVALVVVPVAAAACAVVALRGVVVGPLGVARRVRPRRPGAVRLLYLPVAWTALVAVADSEPTSLLPVLGALGAVVVTVAVVGPWLTWVLGRAMIGLARRTPLLLAGRRIVDDPRGAYRTVSGMVLAGLIAGFLFGVLPSVRANELPDLDRRSIDVEAAVGETGEARLRDAVAAADPGATVELSPEIGDGGRPLEPAVVVGVVVASSVATAEVVRTALVVAVPEATLDQFSGLVDGAAALDADVERGALALALAALAMAVTAAGISAASSILDQRTTLARLRLVGTPLAVLQRARRWQVVVPLVAATVGALATGASAGASLMVALEVDPARSRPPAMGPMALLVVVALVAGIAVVAATRPVLAAASHATPGER